MINPDDQPLDWPTSAAAALSPVAELGPYNQPASDAIDQAEVAPAARFVPLEDRGAAAKSELGDVQYVEDLVRPGRIVAVPAEEGTGKTHAMAELGIRVAVAGGSFAGTWPVVASGPVAVMSEQHPDDDFDLEARVLAALGHERAALVGRYFRLPTLTAAGGPAPLGVTEWRSWLVDELRQRGVLLLIIDTATGAAQVDPWGQPIQRVFADLRAMIAAYPDLAIVLLLHLRKPSGRGGRQLSDVLGEWGRWCDVVMMLEADGKDRTKLTTYKRVRRPRRISATKADGLLIDPVDLDEAVGTKVPLEAVVSALVAEPGISTKALAARLEVSASTAAKYAAMAEEAGLAYRVDLGAGKGFRLYPGENRVGPPPSKGPMGSSERTGPLLDGVGGANQGGTVQPSTHPIRVDGPPIGPPPSEADDGPGSVGERMAAILHPGGEG